MSKGSLDYLFPALIPPSVSVLGPQIPLSLSLFRSRVPNETRATYVTIGTSF